MNLVESILTGNNVEATDLFEARMRTIMEQKLYEMKRSIDLTERVEATGKSDEDGNAQFRGQNGPKDWKEYRKANPTMSFYGTPSNPKAKAPKEKHEKTSLGSITKHGMKMRRKRGYLPAHHVTNATTYMNGVANYLKTGKLNKRDFDAIQPHLDEGTTLAQDRLAASSQAVKAAQKLARERSAAEKAAKAAQNNNQAPGKPGQPVDQVAIRQQKRNKNVDGYASKVFSRNDIDRGDRHQADVDTYDSDKRTAYNLKRAGDKDAVGKFKKAYRTHRFKLAARNVLGKVGGAASRVGNEIASYSNLEEQK